MSVPTSTCEKSNRDAAAVQVEETHPVELTVWLSQYTYYLNETVKGIVSLKVKDEAQVAERVQVYLRCTGHYLHLTEGLTELHRDSQELLKYGEEVTSAAGTIDMRFTFTLPDRKAAFLPSVALGNRKVIWYVYATVEMATGAIYRTGLGQGQFRVGVVYRPMTAFHPRVFSKIKSLLRTPKQVQVSLERPVFLVGEPIKVKLSASVPSRELNGVKIHVVQDVQFGITERSVRHVVSLRTQDELKLREQEVTNEIFEVQLSASKGVAVVEDLSFRDQRIIELAPTMIIQKGGVQYASVSYRLFVELTVGRMVRQYMVLHLPLVLTDLNPPPGMVTHIVQLDPPTEQLPSYRQVATKSKTGRPMAIAPHLEQVQRKLSVQSTSSGAGGSLPTRSPHLFRNQSIVSQTSQASLHFDEGTSPWDESDGGDKGKSKDTSDGHFEAEPPSYEEIVQSLSNPHTHL